MKGPILTHLYYFFDKLKNMSVLNFFIYFREAYDGKIQALFIYSHSFLNFCSPLNFFSTDRKLKKNIRTMRTTGENSGTTKTKYKEDYDKKNRS